MDTIRSPPKIRCFVSIYDTSYLQVILYTINRTYATILFKKIRFFVKNYFTSYLNACILNLSNTKCRTNNGGLTMNNRSEFVEEKIKEMGYNTRSFAKEIGVSYTTLRSMLERNFEGAKIENVIAVSKGIGVTVDYLFNLGTEFEEVEAAHSDDDLTEEEIKEIREFMKKYKK